MKLSTTVVLRATASAVALCFVFAGASPAAAQATDGTTVGSAAPSQPSRLQTLRDDAGGLFGGLFGGSERTREEPSRPQRRARGDEGGGIDARNPDGRGPMVAQMSGPDLVVRLERLENQIRQLTGSIEQLQFRNQQLEQQLRRNQEDADFRFQELGGKTRPRPPQPSAQPSAPAAPAPAPPGRRSDVFDPSDDPSAPGAPRTLGAIPEQRHAGPPPAVADEPPPIGAAGGREAGAPLDLATLAERVARDPASEPQVAALPSEPPPAGPLPAPPPRNPNATGGQRMVMAPTSTPTDELALAQGYVQRKDYALAEESLRAFLKKYPNDKLVADAHYWLGESLYQQQRYRDAAESFLAVSTKHDKSGKAPESLLRLGQSLAAIGEREASCATFGEVARKYPKAAAVKQSAEREQKRGRC